MGMMIFNVSVKSFSVGEGLHVYFTTIRATKPVALLY
jgi:hypothetical protein